MQVYLELLKECDSFKTAYEANQEGVQSILDNAINIAWVMNTLVPPASFHEPEQYHEEWHELVTSSDGTSEMDLESDYKLDYCRPILFFGAEGTVGKVGAVKCRKVAWTEASDGHNPLLQSGGSADQQPADSIELQYLQSKLHNSTQELGIPIVTRTEVTQLPNTVTSDN